MHNSLAESQRLFARALADSAVAVPAGIAGHGAVSAKRRFAIYRNNVAVSLVDALAESFPITVALVGDEFFRAMAREYSANFRPQSPVLLHYGTGLPDFIEAFEPARGVPYLAGVARVESAWTSAYHAADCDPCPASAVAALDQILVDMSVKFLPSMTLVRSEYPVGSIWLAHQSGEERMPTEWNPETVMIFRPAMQVEVAVHTGAKSIFVSALTDGYTIAEAATAAIDVDDTFDPGTALLELVNKGFIKAFRGSEEQ